MAEALRGSEAAERAAVVVYGATALAIEALLATAWRYAASRRAALLLGILLVPKLAAFGYFVVAAVLSARGEGRLSLRGPPG